MSDKPETKKKKKSTETPVHTVREGSVAASIWLRQSPAGFAYYDFSLTRSWKSLSSGNPGSSKNFFAQNQKELAIVINKACAWISAQERQAIAASDLAAA